MANERIICILGLGGGGFHSESEFIISRMKSIPSLVLIWAGPNGGIKKWRTKGRITAEYVVESPTLIGTKKISSMIRTIKNFFFALYIIKRERIELVLGVGTSQIVPFGIAAKLLRRRVIFMESITRINNPSSTQQLVKKFCIADEVYNLTQVALR